MGLFPVSDQGKAHAALFGANLIYGINYSVAKVVMPEFIQPNGFILLRVSGAVLLFWLLASLYKSSEKVERKDWLRLFISALFGVAINQLLFFQGLNLTTPINAAIIMTTNPILVLVAASIMLKERIQWVKIIGIALGLGGASLLILFNSSKANLSFGTNTLLGDLFVFLNATSYALYLVTVKPLMAKYQPITVVKYVFTFGLLMVLPFGWNDISAVEWQLFTWQATASAIFVVVGTTFFAYLFNIYALKKVSPSTVSIYIYSQPLLASLIAIAWGKDQIDAIKVVAAVLIFVGVYLVSVRKTQPK
jgi:drug/metabolite transporter (DMT)-like permease